MGGFTVDTEVWHSAGFYRNFEDMLNKRDNFMTDSFNDNSCGFTVSKASAVKCNERAEIIEVTFGSYFGKGNDTKVKCTPNQKFLTCYENNGKTHYKGNETFFWVEAKDLKEGRRLVAEDANVVVKSVKKINEKADVYTVKMDDTEQNFSIKLGVIVGC